MIHKRQVKSGMDFNNLHKGNNTKSFDNTERTDQPSLEDIGININDKVKTNKHSFVGRPSVNSTKPPLNGMASASARVETTDKVKSEAIESELVNGHQKRGSQNEKEIQDALKTQFKVNNLF